MIIDGKDKTVTIQGVKHTIPTKQTVDGVLYDFTLNGTKIEVRKV